MNDNPKLPSVEGEGNRNIASRGLAFQVGALILIGATLTATTGACFLMVQWLKPSDFQQGSSSDGQSGNDKPYLTTSTANTRAQLFAGWPAPDFVLVLSGQQHGYLLPCGCSKPQYGGIERLYNLIQIIKEQHRWPVLAADLGDIAQRTGPQTLPNVQGVLKFRISMQARKVLGYGATSFGIYEAAGPLAALLDEYSVLPDYIVNGKPTPPYVLAANLRNRNQFPDEVFPWYVAPVPGTQFKVGITGLIGREVEAKIAKEIKDERVKFDSAKDVLPGVLTAMQAQQPQVRLFLFQGPVGDAKICAKTFATDPKFANLPKPDIILCLCDEDEPPAQPDQEGNTLIIRVGHKGKNVGVIGFFRTGNAARPFTLRYQLVSLGPDFETPADKEQGHPILALMEEYTRTLRDQDYLKKYGKSHHPVQFAAKQLPKYAQEMAAYANPLLDKYKTGSETCIKCHERAYEIWKHSPHAHAYKTLVDAKRPSLRQFDGECIVCHVTGFGYKTGFEDAVKTPKLINVGCESCHGPSSLHAAHPNDLELRALINPWKAKPNETEIDRKKRFARIEREVCTRCHDSDNDVHWTFDKWFKGKIIHMNEE